MTSENSRTYTDLKFQLDLLRLLDGCEEADMTPGCGANAVADLANQLSNISTRTH